MILKYYSELPQIQPMCIAIWCGNTKPSDINDYLKQFVEELDHLLINHIDVNGHRITIRIRCFICDTPARALLKGYLRRIEPNQSYTFYKWIFINYFIIHLT